MERVCVGWEGERERAYPRDYWRGGFPYRPDSKAGDAREDSSVVMVKMPSNFRSGRGAVMEAEMRVRTLWKKGQCDCQIVSIDSAS